MNKIPDMNQRHETRKEIDPIGENIQKIADLHKHAERTTTPQQRRIEAVTNFLGRPRFLFIILIVIVLWTLINILLLKLGLPGFDPPPFIWLQALISLGALIQATLILITENRQDEITERRRQLDLQVGFLLDQKISKLITMVDELRQIHPALGDSKDPQIEALKETIDPHQSLETLEQLLNEEE